MASASPAARANSRSHEGQAHDTDPRAPRRIVDVVRRTLSVRASEAAPSLVCAALRFQTAFRHLAPGCHGGRGCPSARRGQHFSAPTTPQLVTLPTPNRLSRSAPMTGWLVWWSPGPGNPSPSVLVAPAWPRLMTRSLFVTVSESPSIRHRSQRRWDASPGSIG